MRDIEAIRDLPGPPERVICDISAISAMGRSVVWFPDFPLVHIRGIVQSRSIELEEAQNAH